MLRRLAPLAALMALAAGCGGSVISPTAQTVIGKLPTQTTPNGNAAAGKTVFLKNACGSCHTFAPAASSGKVGPDLDQLADYAQKAGQPLTEFVHGAIISPPPSYVPPGFPTNAMPATYGSSLSAQDIADLVAFLTKS